MPSLEPFDEMPTPYDPMDVYEAHVYVQDMATPLIVNTFRQSWKELCKNGSMIFPMEVLVPAFSW